MASPKLRHLESWLFQKQMKDLVTASGEYYINSKDSVKKSMYENILDLPYADWLDLPSEQRRWNNNWLFKNKKRSKRNGV